MKKTLTNAASFRVNYPNMIDVLSSGVREEIGSHNRIINATLKLSVLNVAGGGFNVKAQSNGGNFEIIDYISPTAIGETVFLNITEEVNSIIKNENATVVIQIEIPVGNALAFKPAVQLEIEYVPERIMHESNAYYNISAGRAGSGKINLATGALNFVHGDSAASGISHVYNGWQAGETATTIEDIADTENETAVFEHNCGKGWKLNLHQYLVKRAGTDGQDLYTYVDGGGNYHELVEKYYYKAGEEKIYVDKAAVSVALDGKLTHTETGKEVKTELKTTGGRMLQTELKDFQDIEILEQRQDEQKQTEEQLDAYKNGLKDYVAINIADGTINAELGNLFANDALPKANFDNFVANGAASGKMILTKGEALNYKSMKLQYDSMGLQDVSMGLQSAAMGLQNMAMGLQDTAMAKQITGFDLQYSALGTQHTLLGLQNTAMTHQTTGLQIEIDNLIHYCTAKIKNSDELYHDDPGCLSDVNYWTDKKDNLINQKGDITSQQGYIGGQQTNLSNQRTNLDEQKINLSEQKSNLGDQKSNLNDQKTNLSDVKNNMAEQRSHLGNQINAIISKKSEYIIQIKKIFKEYANLFFKVRKLKEQIPVTFLSSGESFMCFNEMGLLVAIADAYENVTYINYEDGKIIGVTHTDGKETKFEYDGESGLLTRIIDANEKVTHFEYYDDTLSKVTYPDGTCSEFNCIGNYLNSAVNSAGYGIKIAYDGQAANKVEEFTSTFEITDAGWRGLNGGEESRPLADITYNTYLSTTLTDRLENSKTYIFDILGKPVTVYEGVYEDIGDNTKSVSMDYSGNKRAFSIADNILYDNLLDGTAPTGNLNGGPAQTRQIAYSVDIQKIGEVTDLVLSGWAKADSAFIASERRTDYSYSKIDEEHIAGSDVKKKNRKFELRAELAYDDNETKTYSASFDWLNTDWQYLALPVTIKEDDEIGDVLPGNFPFILGGEGRKLTGITVYLDYGYNTNAIDFNCLTLRQGTWTYAEFDKDGKRVYAEDGGSGNKTNYEYDAHDNLIKATLTDKKRQDFVNTYEYNKQGRLVRTTDYRGLCEETVFDDKGRAVKSMTYNIADPTSKIYSESVRDEKGEIIADIDITGEFNSTEYTFDHTGVANVITDALGNKTAFGYHNDNLASISGTVDGVESKNTLSYTADFLTKVSSNDTDYTYAYDGFGRQKEIKIAGKVYATTKYISDTKTLTTLATGENFTEYGIDKEAVSVDNFLSEENIPNGIELDEKIEFVKTARTEYSPDENKGNDLVISAYDETTGRLAISVDKSNANATYTTYKYDAEGRLKTKIVDGDAPLEQDIVYADNGSIKTNSYIIDGDTGNEQEYKFKYDHAPDARVEKIELPSGDKQSIKYDGLGRVEKISLGDKFSKNIYYTKNGDHATNYINSVWYGVDGTIKDNTKYAYDKRGNIVSVKENGKETARYEYDNLNRLIVEYNAEFGMTKYAYDSNGNILSKTVNGGNPIEYAYAAEGWRDNLTSYNGQPIGGYDDLGNPETYRGKKMKWERGRLLTGYDWDGTGAFKNIYTYNAEGIRTSKIANGIETTYYLDGTQIIAEERKDLSDSSVNMIYYRYGADGICGFKYNGTEYVYRKSIQGDITHIYTADGAFKAKYIYDAWGNASFTNESEEILARLNPFLYRGYYFDSYYDANTDTYSGMYYLNTRYYDSEIGRFINADMIQYLEPETVNGLNLFVYCGNNPICFTDPFGTTKWWEWLIAGVIVAGLIVATVFTFGAAAPITGLAAAMVVGATIGASVSLVSQAIFTGELSWGQFALDIGVGAITGMLGVSGISKVASMFIGAGIGGISNIASQLISRTSFKNLDLLSIGISTVVGGAAGWFAGAGTQNAKAVGNAPGVQKAAMSVKAVQNRIASGTYYATAGGMKSALTQVTNKFTLAVGQQMAKMFLSSMIYFGVGMAIDKLADWLYNKYKR